MNCNVSLFIDGEWRASSSAETIPVVNPATEEVVGQVAHATKADLDQALAAAEKGFRRWRKTSAFDRSKLMRPISPMRLSGCGGRRRPSRVGA
jgi:succinate-semialdehyde dehydrogenase / glutarate-semialdehyde dehydrogenase